MFFKTLPLHSIPWHPLPTQQTPRYLHSLSFFMCRVTCPLGHHYTISWLLLLGHALSRPTSPVTATPRPLYTMVTPTALPRSRPCPAWAGTGHLWTLFSSVGETARPTRRPQRAWAGGSTSPQELEFITVRLPCGTGHGKGPQGLLGSSRIGSLSRPSHVPSDADRRPATAPGHPARPYRPHSRLDAQAV
jgi:hypothetical protein